MPPNPSERQIPTVPLTIFVYIGLGKAASWINLVLKLARTPFNQTYLIVSEGVTATVASTTPAPRPASIVRPGLSFPCHKLDCRVRLLTSGSLKSSLMESYVMKRTPAFKPFPTTKAPHPEYSAVTPPDLIVFETIATTPCFWNMSAWPYVSAQTAHLP